MFSKYRSILVLSCNLSLWCGGVTGWLFLVITVSHPTFCCVGVRLWSRWGWAVTTPEYCINTQTLHHCNTKRTDSTYRLHLITVLPFWLTKWNYKLHTNWVNILTILTTVYWIYGLYLLSMLTNCTYWFCLQTVPTYSTFEINGYCPI